MNAYRMLQMLRDGVGEATAAHWTDDDLLRTLNGAQRRVGFMLALSPGDWLVTSASVSPSSSKITIPDACSKPVYLEETSSGREIPIMGTVRERRLTRPEGTTLHGGLVDAYMEDNYIVVNQEGYGEGCTLWYQKRVVDLHAGTGDTGSAATKLFFDGDNNPSVIDDYYTGQTVEIVSGTGIGISEAITAYEGSTGEATIVGTASTSSVYGTKSALPEEATELITLMATVRGLAKPDSVVSDTVLQYWMAQENRARKDFEDWVETRVANSTANRIRTTEYE